MKTIKGVYENGQIKLLENSNISGTKKVLITFYDEDDDDDNEEIIIRNISVQYSDTMKEYLNDPREDLYQEYLK